MDGDRSAGDDPLDDLGQELRERIGSEMRQEAEMAEHEAAVVERRRRRLEDVARDLVSRGDTVSVFAGDRSIRGILTYARGDIALLETAEGLVDVHLAASVVVRVDRRSTAGGIASRRGADTLRARLLEHEMAAGRLELWCAAQGLEIAGELLAVGKDHVIMRNDDAQEWTIPLSEIAWVLVPR